MIAILKFSYKGENLGWVSYNTNTPNLVESAKIVTEVCKMFDYCAADDYVVSSSLHPQADWADKTPQLSREFIQDVLTYHQRTT